jgi:poly-gamma-glutamate capsule biosynthesis protein CapA/YwtB (metallophosphatase superfamily)
MSPPAHTGANGSDTIAVFLCGDVMLGRGIDQVLPHPSDPRLYESYVASATDYLHLAEASSGWIPRPVDFAYVLGHCTRRMAAARARCTRRQSRD